MRFAFTFLMIIKFLFYFIFTIVFRHLVQIFSFLPSIFFDCRLTCCLFVVLILEWERLASLVEPRPHKSHFFAIREK